MASRAFPAFSPLSLFAQVIVGSGIFTSSGIESTHLREKLDRKRMTRVVLGGGELKKVMAGRAAAP